MTKITPAYLDYVKLIKDKKVTPLYLHSGQTLILFTDMLGMMDYIRAVKYEQETVLHLPKGVSYISATTAGTYPLYKLYDGEDSSFYINCLTEYQPHAVWGNVIGYGVWHPKNHRPFSSQINSI